MSEQEYDFDKSSKIARETLHKLINCNFQPHKETKLEIFERWMGNLAMFLLAPFIIIMNPLVIWAEGRRR